MPRPLRTLIIAAGALALGVSPANAAASIEGRWYTKGERAIVTIERCGKSVCGRISKFIEQPRDGVTTDINNPDPALRNRKLLGLPILSGFVADGNQWRGKVYDPEGGKTYRSVVQPVGANRLKVEGCVLFFCRGETWTRAD